MTQRNNGAPSKETICILPNRLMLGGIEKVLTDALQVLHTKYDIEIVCFLDSPCQAVLDAIPEGVKVTYKKLPGGKIGKLCSKIPYLSGHRYKKVLGGRYYDHLLVLRPSVMEAVFANVARHKVFWCHNDHYREFGAERLSLKKRIAKMVRRAVYKKYDMIWTVSETTAKEMGECFSLDNIYPLPNPLDCDRIEKKAQGDCDLVFDRTQRNLIMIGRMSKEKGFYRVLRAMCGDLLSKYPDVHLYVIGNGTTDDHVRAYVEKSGMADRVSLLGPKADPYPYLKQAQALICPSWSESFGLVMLEAMLLKVDVITTDTVGGRYITQDGKYGRCVQNDDAALCGAIRAYLEGGGGYPREDAQKWAYAHDIRYFNEKLLDLLDDAKTTR